MKKRMLEINLCTQCRYASTNYKYCKHPYVLYIDRGWLSGRDFDHFDQFPIIPDWCPLEEADE